MTVIEIVKQYLKENGYDGLCNEDCGCVIDDLAPCEEMSEQCEAGYKHTVNTEEWYIRPEKPEEAKNDTSGN